MWLPITLGRVTSAWAWGRLDDTTSREITTICHIANFFMAETSRVGGMLLGGGMVGPGQFSAARQDRAMGTAGRYFDAILIPTVCRVNDLNEINDHRD